MKDLNYTFNNILLLQIYIIHIHDISRKSREIKQKMREIF